MELSGSASALRVTSRALDRWWCLIELFLVPASAP